ncbi:MAG: hypothetical protein ABIJ97_15190 [Bacteroidota bacterium]
MKFLLLIFTFCLILFHIGFNQALLGPQEFNTDVIVHGSSAPTSVWFAPDYYTPIDYSAIGGCSNGHAAYQGAWNNYWMNFLRTPAVNCTGLDSVILCFNMSNSFFASHTNDKVYFNMWIDGGYHNAIVNQTINFNQLRDCEYFEVIYDLTPYIDKTAVLFYFNASCGYNDSQSYFIKLDSISLKADQQLLNIQPYAGQNDSICGNYICMNNAALENTGNTALWYVLSKPTVGSIVNFTNPTVVQTCLSVSDYGLYEFVLSETDGLSTGYDTVSINFLEIPIPYAGNDQFVCGLTTLLNATGSGFSDNWQLIDSVSFNDVNNPSTTITATDYGTFQLVWVSENGECLSFDTVQIEFDPCTFISQNENFEQLFDISIDHLSNILNIFIKMSNNIDKIEIFSSSSRKIFSCISPQETNSIYLDNGLYYLVIYQGQKRQVKSIFM